MSNKQVIKQPKILYLCRAVVIDQTQKYIKFIINQLKIIHSNNQPNNTQNNKQNKRNNTHINQNKLKISVSGSALNAVVMVVGELFERCFGVLW